MPLYIHIVLFMFITYLSHIECNIVREHGSIWQENQTELLLREKRATCKPKVIISDCPQVTPALKIKYFTYEFIASVTPGCKRSEIVYKWQIRNEDTMIVEKQPKGTQEMFVLPALSLNTGNYVVHLTVSEILGTELFTSTYKCSIIYSLENPAPVPIIKGFVDRTIAPRTSYIINGNISLNYEESTELKPIWEVLCIPVDNCKPSPDYSKCITPNKTFGLVWILDTQDCYSYNITLKLKWRNDIKNYPSRTQHLFLVREKNRATSHLECLSYNCDSFGFNKVNRNFNVDIIIKCDSNCKAKTSYSVRLAEEQTPHEYLPNSVFDLNRLNTVQIIRIQEKKLKPGHRYILQVLTLNEQNTPLPGALTMSLETFKNLQIICQITPSKGVCYETLFNINCNKSKPFDYPLRMLVAQANEFEETNGVQLIDTTKRIFDVRLGPTIRPKSVDVRVFYAATQYEAIKRLTVEVTCEKLDTVKAMKELKSLIQSNQLNNAMQMGNALLMGGLKLLNDSEKLALQSEILHEFNKIEITYVSSYNAIGSLVPLLQQKPYSLHYVKKLKAFCSKLLSIEGVQRYLTPDINIETIYQYKGMLENCINSNLEEEATLNDTVVTTPETGIIIEEIVTESYPDYNEELPDDKLTDSQDSNHEARMSHAVKIGKDLPHGQFIKKKILNEEMFVSKNTPKVAHAMKHQFTNGEYKYSNKISGASGYDSIVSVAMGIGKDNYIVKNQDIVTQVVDLRTIGIDSRNNVTHINAGVEVTFTNYSMPIITYAQGMNSLPTNFKEWTEELLNEKMTVHRLNVFQGEACYIKFNSTTNFKFQVAISQNIRPNITDFTNGFTIDSSNISSLEISPVINTSDANSWVYVAVLLHKDMFTSVSTELLTVNYSVKFMSKSCVHWNADSRNWDSIGCFVVASTDEKLICRCNHSSIFAGTISNITSKLDPINVIHFEISLTGTYTIYYFVAIVFGLYCIVICFSLKRSKVNTGRENLFFLGDNLKNDTFAYILIVKTGNIKNAGTTSNIMVKMFGNNNNSKEHVLNYPDPDKQLLQRDSEQWFVLTTDQYLGEINKIDLWFDSIGYRPTWYCETLRVIDLQKFEFYYFNVQQWLDVLKNCHIFSTSPSVENSEPWHGKLLSNFKFHIGAEHTWNIFRKTDDEDFSYFQRVTVILSQILNTYAFALLMYGPPELRLRDGFSIGSYSSEVKMTLVGIFSGILSFIINTIIVILFRHSSNQIDSRTLIIIKKLLPKYENTSAWIILITSINISLIYLIMCGFWLPEIECTMWIVSTTIGLLINIFILESLFLSLQELFLKYYARKHIINERIYNFRHIIQEIEGQRRELYKKFGEYLLRPYLDHLYQILSDNTVLAKATMNRNKLDISHMFQDFVLFVIYVICLYLLVFNDRDRLIYDSNKCMGQLVSEGLSEEWYPLDRISNYNEIYTYINNTIIPALHGKYWYDNYEIVNFGSMVDFSNKLIGVAQIRQQRTAVVNCQLPDTLNYLNLWCHHETQLTYLNHSNGPYFRNNVWYYQSATNTGLPPVTGSITRYNGGGFLAKLGRTEANSRYVLNYLKNRNWLDINTKAVIIDFWAYNANHNLFNVVQILIERSNTGFMLKSYKVFTDHLLINRDIHSQIFNLVNVLIFLLIIITALVRHITHMVKQKRKYFKIFWNYIDLIIISQTLCVIIMDILRTEMVETVLKRVMTDNNNDFVLYFSLIRMTQSLTLLSALLVCLATFRLWKFLRFGVIFRVMERTIIKSSVPLAVNTMYMFLILCAFSSAGYIVFGIHHPNMHSFLRILSTMTILSFGFTEVDTQPDIINKYMGYLGQFYKTMFLIASLTIYSIITTIICNYLDESKTFYSNITEQYTIIDYVKEELRYMSELFVRRAINIRLRGGADNTELEELDNSQARVYAKSQEHRYADHVAITQSKLRSMTVIVRSILRKHYHILAGTGNRRITRPDYKLMAEVVLDAVKQKASSEYDEEDEQEKVLFFPLIDNNEKMQIIRDDRICEIEYAVKRMVNDAPERESEPELVLHHAKGDAERLKKIEESLDRLLNCVDSLKFVL